MLSPVKSRSATMVSGRPLSVYAAVIRTAAPSACSVKSFSVSSVARTSTSSRRVRPSVSSSRSVACDSIS